MVEPLATGGHTRSARVSSLHEEASLETPIRPTLTALRRRLDALYGGRLFLYGSYARGEARADSDVDVMVVLYGDVDPIAEIRRMGPALTDLLLESALLVSVHPISRARFASGASALAEAVRREGIPA